ncbi:unnamed protein product [Rotaria sp. Silwood1]|nr:unnamed protein product [Rotaria sp. Silwood1]CAF3481348.1 unnamed protein product [Rotaria sp. Silwood1]CAF3498403.1 unnamed protein product [Rotaria sp. Silwood1]CAF4551517.1 unnamed protein product [Rotaria sp. Silwood1]CAF4676490.1 unnamed protein product [Rotaria sp. Silwood1]
MIVIRFIFIIYITNATYLYFDRNSYEIYISESTQIYSKIALIKAISAPSLSIQYELHGDTNKTFYLNSLTGELILLNSIDYETISIYKLTAEARSPSSIAPCFAELIIHILNINDNSPDINLIIYPSVLYKSNIIKYDLNTSSTPFATINIKDLDQSTNNLSLYLNDTKHFQIQLIREYKNNLIYILSTKNNSQLIYQDNYYLLLISCDNDQPLLCTNQTYIFHMKSNEYLCNLSFNQKTYIIDIKENLPNKTFLMHKITNKFCRNIIYTIDNTKNFYIDSYTGDLYTLKKFNRTKQSIYFINLFVNNYIKINIIVRILDQYGNIPFLINKYMIMNQNKFSFVHIFNSTLCRSQIVIENYFQLLSNCTIISLMKPPLGQYLFNIELEQQINHQDTFLLELKEQERLLTFRHSPWIIIIPTIICVLFVLGTIISLIIIIKQKRYKFNQLCYEFLSSLMKYRFKSNTENVTPHSDFEKSDVVSTISKLKVYDDHELSSSQTSTAIYLVQKSSPPLSSLSPLRDDEGYSGSSNVSENHLQFESTIISTNELNEQYRIHEFPNRQSTSPKYDVPRRYIDKMNTPCISTDASLV